ncbi:glycosyltransferase family A protein [Bradyrhizobium sp. CB1650]|uniref:glycosyltransferase family 2 protein n=1 Tax=Bradyrhizobium sp. CB1650 TaxID=3039153 RepID=UPI0024356783|nr:glycosyltransferase family A protein [Bradyrhizobium sp. CB1650]WGD54931.1 glycosyltransferase family A protein [Bradyrhizobium sp. CB1650]
MASPSVSIVVPLYNKAHCILKTLSSVASQGRTDFELIVVDDGSTDGSAKLVKGAGMPDLRLIQQANAGASAARNRGIAAAQGAWIAFLDGDDLWSCDHLEGLLRSAEETAAVAVFSNLRLESRAGQPLIDAAVLPQTVDDYFSFALSHGNYPASSSSIMVRRDEFFEAGLFAEGIAAGEDIDMWCRLACRGPFVYNARLSATYTDASSSNRAAAPLFAQRLPRLIRDGKVPPQLVESAKRYANFLMLEYARQLLDHGRYAEARAVLLNDCIASYDARRFFKRLSRTSPLGRMLFRLSRTDLVQWKVNSSARH